jgi:3-oxoacyl-[acyl-carrier-protein] synthase-3
MERVIEWLRVGIPKTIVARQPSPELEKFERVTGIKKTRRAKHGIQWSILSTLDRCPKSRPDNIIVVTQTPDQFSPCTAVWVQDHLKLPKSTLCFDVNHACDGWVVGFHLASRLPGKTMLICADQLRYEPNPIEGLIFSDAVSITLIDSDPSKHSLCEFKAYTDGSKARLLRCELDGEMVMRGDAVFDFVTTEIPKFIASFALSPHVIVPHQANLSMHKILAMRTGAGERLLSSIEEYGNQSMNSIPTCITMHEDSILGRDVLCVGFGAGFTAAGAIISWPESPVCAFVEIE